eukprot:TRINITY_DN47922_c0_g1_i1.p1 TRINITY_DN47922_c0_g1~~TRINITY_DN47922_c0_g1_i1.p1  ORF type:complete len:896 (+),score=205.69 TRINITY_DN47922_c0_g1_i1:39-2726(+)
MAASAACLATPPPVRIALKSHDKITQISMKISWVDDQGQQQNWNSWEDALSGRYGATKLLPAGSSDIQVRFRVQPGGRKVHAVDRHRKCAWTRSGEELISLRGPGQGEQRNVDAWFELRGPITHCHVWRAWNAGNEGNPEPWEYWPDFPRDRVAAAPLTLQTADLAAPWPGHGNEGLSPKSDTSGSSVEEDCAGQVSSTMARLVAAAEVLLSVRLETFRALEELNSKLTKQWYKANSGNTLSAGLAVASFGSLFVAPPLAITLGAASAASGMGTTTSDVFAEHGKSRSLTKLVEQDLYEQLGFEAVEAELRTVLETAAQASLKKSHRQVGGQRRTTRALSLGAQTASVLAVRSARAVTITRAGAQSLSVAGKVFGGMGAGLALGVAIHGWSTTKPTQKLVQEKLSEVQRSVDYLHSLLQQMAGVLRCPCCEEIMYFGRSEGGTCTIRRCPQFHCFHADCVKNTGRCPLCPSDAASVSSLGTSRERLRAVLWLSGLRDFCVLTADSFAPQVLRSGRELVTALSTRVDEVRSLMAKGQAYGKSGSLEAADICHEFQEVQGRSPSRSPALLSEDASTHEAWQSALEEVNGNFAELPGQALECLLAESKGMPLNYRHRLWPLWLGVPQRRAQSEAKGTSFAVLACAELPELVLEQISLDVPRTRSDFVPAEQREDLKRVLVALSAHRPEVRYAQGMNQLAAVLLKLGFEDETAFWMLDAMLEELLPGCHHPDLHGLFRDTAVSDILVKTFLPAHATAFAAAGIEVLWLSVDYFITLGADAPLPLVASLWDLCFLHGARAIFGGFLAFLELFFPLLPDSPGWVGGRSDRSCSSEAELDPEKLLHGYKAALLEAPPDAFAARVLDFINVRQGGVTAELVDGLRSSVGAGASPTGGMGGYPS